MLQSDRGLVLRTYKLRETSKIASVLGFERGRVRLVARGSRGGRHRFGASLEVGNEVEVVYTLAPERELGTLREATLRHGHLAGASRLDAMGAGLAVIELLDRLVPEGAGEPGLGEEASAALAALSAATDRGAVLLLFYGFECRLLAHMGLEPHLTSCAACGRPAGETASTLDVRDGALRCRACQGTAGAGRLLLPPEASALLSAVASGPSAAVARLQSNPRTRRLVGVCLHRLLTTHLERYRYPRSLDLLKKVDMGKSNDVATDPDPRFRTMA
jgi:DNA repair protein RecO (recombination protein O)